MQICGARLLQCAKNPETLGFGVRLEDTALIKDKVVSDALSGVVMHIFRTNSKLLLKSKIDVPIDFEMLDFDGHFLRTHKRIWKVCFHIKTANPIEEDPC
jgi:hypothetical protein